MKELWAHLIHFDPEWEPYIKKIRKAQRLGEYKIITDVQRKESSTLGFPIKWRSRQKKGESAGLGMKKCLPVW
ncbi:MAG: hypothetical protein ACLVG5_03455 [Clostridium sp.]